ncbi:MAG TPA: MdtA/MuxA family multidrug efflux RND transporter periplasmic adaptor subunit [Candidatus Cybelea sp.]|nr:MdtA/MuxA family multidrug efflux RND transporter periplasmic adaptor subunit [Candidatus Cybelea sp.]
MNDLNHRGRDRDTRTSWQEPPARSPLWRRIAWGLAAVLVAGGIAWWIHSRPQQQPAAGRINAGSAMPVVAATAEKGDIAVIVGALGTVTPMAVVTVRTQISGQLIKVDFKEGQTVAKGDELAEIDSRPYEHALAQAQGQLLKDQALLKNAELDWTRYRTLAAQDSIAKQQVDTQEYLVRQYQGAVATDQALVDNAKLNIAYCHIVAPVSGRVGLRQVDPGNYVQANDANGIVVIAQVQPISVIFTIAEDEVPAVMKRLNANASLPVTAFNRAGTTQLAVGKLETLDNQIDTTTGTVKLRATFDNKDQVLFPNQFVNVQLQVDVLHDATVVPTAAIQRGAPGTFVYLVNADDTVAVRTVKLGPTESERVAIRSGLTPGDRVVVDGADKLKDGAKITSRAAASPGGDTGSDAVPSSRAKRNSGAPGTAAPAQPGQPAQPAQ